MDVDGCIGHVSSTTAFLSTRRQRAVLSRVIYRTFARKDTKIGLHTDSVHGRPRTHQSARTVAEREQPKYTLGFSVSNCACFALTFIYKPFINCHCGSERLLWEL